MRTIITLFVILLISATVMARSDSLSGTWNITYDFDLTTGNIKPSADFTLDWSDSILDLSVDCSLSMDGLEEVRLSGSFRLGDFDFNGEMDLEGQPPFFDGAELSINWPGKYSSWDLLLDITGSASNTSLILEGAGNLSFGRWKLEIEMGGCGSEFEELTVQLSDMEFCCLTDIEFELAFDCGGFDGAEISFSDIEIAALSFISIAGAIAYELDSNAMTTRFVASPEASDSCIGVGFKLVTEGLSITAIEISNVNLRCDIGAIRFAYVHTTAWDAITLSGKGSGEYAVSWRTQVYMKDSSPYLFNGDSISFNFTYSPCSAYSFTMKTQLAMTGDIEIELTLRGRW